MKFFIDANLPYSSKKVFQQYGETLHAKDYAMMKALDEEIYQTAIKEKAVLVSKDLGFGNPYLFPRNSHYGIIIVRVPFYFTATQINQTFTRQLPKIDFETIARSVVVIEPGKLRQSK